MVKMINEIDQSDIELHNRQKALLCDTHKDKAIEFFCIDCDKFSCQKCDTLYHKKHDCISIEDADAKLCLEIDNSVKKVQGSINLNEKNVKKVKLLKKSLEKDKNKLLESVQNIVKDMKEKLKIDYEKIIETIDECYNNIAKLIVGKADEKKIKLEKTINEIQEKLKSLQETVLSFERHAPPFSTVVDRASFLKDNSITRLSSKLEVIEYYLDHQLPDISQWKNAISKWSQSLTKLLTDNTTELRFLCFLYLYMQRR